MGGIWGFARGEVDERPNLQFPCCQKRQTVIAASERITFADGRVGPRRCCYCREVVDWRGSCGEALVHARSGFWESAFSALLLAWTRRANYGPCTATRSTSLCKSCLFHPIYLPIHLDRSRSQLSRQGAVFWCSDASQEYAIWNDTCVWIDSNTTRTRPHHDNVALIMGMKPPLMYDGDRQSLQSWFNSPQLSS